MRKPDVVYVGGKQPASPPPPPTVQKQLPKAPRGSGESVTIKTHRREQERRRIAEARLKSEEEHAEGLYRWVAENLNRERQLSDRCTYLYGLAASLGATQEQLCPSTKETDHAEQ